MNSKRVYGRLLFVVALIGGPECFAAFSETYFDTSERASQNVMGLTEAELRDWLLSLAMLSVPTEGDSVRLVAHADGLPAVLDFMWSCLAVTDSGIGCDGGEWSCSGEDEGDGDEGGPGGGGYGGEAGGDGGGASYGGGTGDGPGGGGEDQGGSDGGGGNDGGGGGSDGGGGGHDNGGGGNDGGGAGVAGDDNGHHDGDDEDKEEDDEDGDNESGDGRDDDYDDDDDDDDGEEEEEEEEDCSDDDGSGDDGDNDCKAEGKGDDKVDLDENNSILLQESTNMATSFNHSSGYATSLSSGQLDTGSSSTVGSNFPDTGGASAQLDSSGFWNAASLDLGRFPMDDCRLWKTCRKCMHHEWRVVFIPCGHLACFFCSGQIINMLCIFCDASIEGIQAVRLQHE